MTPPALSAHPRLAPSVRLRRDPVSGQPILLYPEGHLELSATAHDILSRCDGLRPLHEILALLAAEYDAPAVELEADVLACLEELRARQFLTFDP